VRSLADAKDVAARAGVLAACCAIGQCRVWTQPPERSGSATDHQMAMCGSFIRDFAAAGGSRDVPSHRNVTERMGAIATPPLGYASGYKAHPSVFTMWVHRWNSVATIERHHPAAPIGPVLTTDSILPPS
jgi:hypothetical protein